MKKIKRHAAGNRWSLKGYKGDKPFYSNTLPSASWTEPRIIILMQRLLSRSMTNDDIVQATRMPKDQFYTSTFKERRETKGGRITVTVGENPFYVATYLKAEDSE